MIRHPAPSIIAKQLRHLADTLDDEGPRAITRAQVLASRGYPTSTGGMGVNGGRSDTTSTERAAGLPGNDRGLTPPDYADIDDTLAKLLRVLWDAALRTENTIGSINSHASDDDPVPAGTGWCQACDLLVRPTAKKPDFRLRSGFCPADYHAWRRWRTHYPDCTIDQFIYTRWLQTNPEGTADQYLEWRRQKIEAA